MAAWPKVAFEHREAGLGVFGCELSLIDFVAYAKACGADGSVARNRRKFDR
jgi:thiamine pyrophosphate-dependent acetolactate synthase large subunit-like protein